MQILENVPLTGYSTMRLGGPARYLAELSDRNEIPEALAWAKQNNLPVIMIGSGSNIVWRDEGFPGLVLVNRIRRFEVTQEDADNLYVTIGGGENWDETVEKCVTKNFSGLEFLSAIPGTVGAAPVQNIGAYGHELSDVLLSVEAYDSVAQRMLNIPVEECAFGYRTSRFKTTDRGRFFITAITCHLTSRKPQPPFYHVLEEYLKNNGIAELTPASIRQAVVAIRAEKLPDPSTIANNGSFFSNPIISSVDFHELYDKNPGLQSWPSSWFWEQPDGQYKIAAGALLEVLNFKGVSDPETGMGTWPKQALVMVNQNATSTASLLKFKQKIVDAVKARFGITLEQEPELLP